MKSRRKATFRAFYEKKHTTIYGSGDVSKNDTIIRT